MEKKHKKIVSCSECKRTFKNEIVVWTHIAYEHTNQSSRRSNSRALNTTKALISCSPCKKSFESEAEFDQHIENLQVKETNTANVAKQILTNGQPTKLNQKQNIVENNDSDKLIQSPQSLEIETAKCSSYKIYCALCRKRFNSENAFWTHAAFMHVRQQEDSSVAVQLVCDNCKQVFDSLDKVKEHLHSFNGKSSTNENSAIRLNETPTLNSKTNLGSRSKINTSHSSLRTTKPIKKSYVKKYRKSPKKINKSSNCTSVQSVESQKGSPPKFVPNPCYNPHDSSKILNDSFEGQEGIHVIYDDENDDFEEDGGKVDYIQDEEYSEIDNFLESSKELENQEGEDCTDSDINTNKNNTVISKQGSDMGQKDVEIDEKIRDEKIIEMIQEKEIIEQLEDKKIIQKSNDKDNIEKSKDEKIAEKNIDEKIVKMSKDEDIVEMSEDEDIIGKSKAKKININNEFYKRNKDDEKILKTSKDEDIIENSKDEKMVEKNKDAEIDENRKDEVIEEENVPPSEAVVTTDQVILEKNTFDVSMSNNIEDAEECENDESMNEEAEESETSTSSKDVSLSDLFEDEGQYQNKVSLLSTMFTNELLSSRVRYLESKVEELKLYMEKLIEEEEENLVNSESVEPLQCDIIESTTGSFDIGDEVITCVDDNVYEVEVNTSEANDTNIEMMQEGEYSNVNTLAEYGDNFTYLDQSDKTDNTKQPFQPITMLENQEPKDQETITPLQEVGLKGVEAESLGSTNQSSCSELKTLLDGESLDSVVTFLNSDSNIQDETLEMDAVVFEHIRNGYISSQELDSLFTTAVDHPTS